VGERRGRETSDLDPSLPTSSEPHIEVTAHEDTRAGREGGCAAHWKPPAVAPTPMAMDVAGKEEREAHLRWLTWRREAEMVWLARSRCHRPPLRVTWRSEGGKKGEGTSELDLTVSLY